MTSYPFSFTSLRPRALFLLALMAHALLLQTAPVLAASRASSPSEQTDTDRQEQDRRTEKKQLRFRESGNGIADQLQSLLSASSPDFEAGGGTSAQSNEHLSQLVEKHFLPRLDPDDLKTALDYLGELLIRTLRGEEVIDSKIQEGLKEGQGIPRENFLAGQRVRVDVSGSRPTIGDQQRATPYRELTYKEIYPSKQEFIVPLADQYIRAARLRQILAFCHAIVKTYAANWHHDERHIRGNGDWPLLLGISGMLFGMLFGIFQPWYPLAAAIPFMLLGFFMGLSIGTVVERSAIALYNSHIDRAAARDLWATMADSVDSTLDSAPDLRASREFRQLTQALRKGNTQKANSIATQMACDHALGGSQLNLLYPSSTPITSASHDQQGESAEGQLTETADPDVVEVGQSSSPGKTTL